MSQGELVVVFDADHVPARSFLTETVGYFDLDPRLFLVQTPHFFINPDPLERNLRTFSIMPSENEMFYGVIQRGLDKWNAAFFCGSAAVLRREALVTTNGFSGLTITEDCETALELHSRGWNSVYVDKPLIAGLQPETFASFIGQRSRWAQGMMQILRFQFPPFKRGLHLGQRLCYMSSTLFWLFPFNRWIFLISPFFYLFFSLEIFVASGAEFMAYTTSYMAVNLMMQNYLYGRYRWPWISELYEYIQSVYLLPAVVSVMLNPKKPTFKVTAKNESLDKSYISELGRPFFIIFALLALAVGVTLWKVVTQPYQADVTLVVGLWNVLNLIIAGCALGVVSERQSDRQSQRINVERWCKIEIEGQGIPAVIENVSVRGLGIRPMAPSHNLKPGDTTEDHHRHGERREDPDAADHHPEGRARREGHLPRRPHGHERSRLQPGDRRPLLCRCGTMERLPGGAAPQYRRSPRDGALSRHRALPDRPRPFLSLRPAASRPTPAIPRAPASPRRAPREALAAPRRCSPRRGWRAGATRAGALQHGAAGPGSDGASSAWAGRPHGTL